MWGSKKKVPEYTEEEKTKTVSYTITASTAVTLEIKTNGVELDADRLSGSYYLPDNSSELTITFDITTDLPTILEHRILASINA